MPILITGAAGMIGRKLTARLVKDAALNGKPIDALALLDVVAPPAPAGFSGALTLATADLTAAGEAKYRMRSTIAGRSGSPARRSA